MKNLFLNAVLLGATLLACGVTNAGSAVNFLDPLMEIRPAEKFTCVHETLPKPPADADVLYQYAKWMHYEQPLLEYPRSEIERLYRIAAENGHHEANIKLQRGVLLYEFELDVNERLRLSKQLIDADVAMGYHYMGELLQDGSLELEQDTRSMALRYYRKAADMGNATAQTFMGDKTNESHLAPEVASQMWQCAADQGDSEAITVLGMELTRKGRYSAAFRAFQHAVASGNYMAADFLANYFRDPKQLAFSGGADLERARRYEQLGDMLRSHSNCNPKVPEIDEIVPVPPATLPAWNGKLKWVEAHLSSPPPEKPSAALITKLAKAKGLDPATGKPLASSSEDRQANALSQGCHSGDACPRSGYPKVVGSLKHTIRRPEVTHQIQQCQCSSLQPVAYSRLCAWPLPSRTCCHEETIAWRLLG